MDINFNKEFKGFLSNSQVYKNIVNYIKKESKNDNEDILYSKLKGTKAVMECLIINHERLYNTHFLKENISHLIDKNYSKSSQEFVNNNNNLAEYVKLYVFLYFLDKKKELPNLLEEIHAVVPDESIKINFNKNFKDFIENSVICKKLEKVVKKDLGFNNLSEAEQKFNQQLIKLSLECVIYNYDVIETSSFLNAYPTDEKKKIYSLDTKNFIKENKNIDILSRYINSVITSELIRDIALYSELVEEITEQSMQKQNKAIKKNKM